MKPLFLTFDEALQIHADILEPGEDDGLRDVGLLESALAQPQQGWGGEYVYKDLPSMAAAYLFHIAKHHAFENGDRHQWGRFLR